jgi:asparagine synthase (glutamine-hydrolysing)
MCGIAGVVDLSGKRTVAPEMIQAMATAILHRGPDEDGFLERPGLALASRRLSIVGLADGRQPIHNEDGTVSVVFNGELFEYPELRVALEKRGHRFATHCDTEIIPHLWEDYQEGLFEHLKGQFAFALWDQRRQRLILARDRFGICPLHWTRRGDWLLFASEIKALLASGMVPARPDLRGINHVFTFFALPGPVTCFEGVQSLSPGHYLEVAPGGVAAEPIRERIYWEMDFPDRGDEDRTSDAGQLVDEFEAVLLRSVDKRLRADVPVGAYLSGGVDSSMVVALACKVLGRPVPTYTVRIADPELDEVAEATLVARHLGANPVIRNFDTADTLNTYPRLVAAAEGPVVDTSCAALLLLAERVNANGHKVVLTGEGADEWLAGYPWYKADKLLGWLDLVPGLRLSALFRRTFLWLNGVPQFSAALQRRAEEAMGGPSPWTYIYGLMSLSKLRFFGPALRDLLERETPYADLGLNLERARRWHPLNRALYLGARIHLAGSLLHAKGDRVAMHSSVETRYPFLDEDVFAFLARLHPRWKLHGFREKYLLRLLAERWLPRAVARRRKVMFRAPLDSFYLEGAPAFVEDLLSEASLRRTGYFDPAAVQHWRTAYRQLRRGSMARISVEMGLAGVISTQLWHHLYIDGSLADLPSKAASGGREAPGSSVRAPKVSPRGLTPPARR